MFDFSITRVIDGQPHEIFLTEEEMFQAMKIYNTKYFYNEIKNTIEEPETLPEETLIEMAENAEYHWESGDYVSMSDCIIHALNDAYEEGIVTEWCY